MVRGKANRGAMTETYPYRDVAGHTLVEPVFTENPECRSQSSFQIISFDQGVVEGWWLRKSQRFQLGATHRSIG